MVSGRVSEYQSDITSVTSVEHGESQPNMPKQESRWQTKGLQPDMDEREETRPPYIHVREYQQPE